MGPARAARYAVTMQQSLLSVIVLAFALAFVLASACAHPAATGNPHAPSATTPGISAPGLTPRTAPQTTHETARIHADARCAGEELQPELFDMSAALANEQNTLLDCLPIAATTELHVTFVVDVHGRARDVAVNGATQGGAARCIRRALRRVSLRGRRDCPTTGEFIIAGLPNRRRGATGRAWLDRARR